MPDRLSAGETPGDRIQVPNHVLYKVRVRNTDAARGKRGGYRIIYYVQAECEILLVAIYSKSDQGDIAHAELLDIIDPHD